MTCPCERRELNDVPGYGVSTRGDFEPLVKRCLPRAGTLPRLREAKDGGPDSVSWNRVMLWIRQLESLSRASSALVSLKGSCA